MVRIEGLVLAAGLSRRMGTNKMLMEVNGSTIIEKTINLLQEAPISGISIVIGNCSHEIRKVLAGYPLNFIYNPDYRLGMSSSIRWGIKSVSEQKEIDAVLLMLGDMPLITADTIIQLIEEYKKTRRLILVPRYQEQRGHPVLFSREIFPYLLKIKGDNGAREVVNRFLEQVLFVDVDDRGIVLDLDTKEDINNILNHS